MICWFSCCYLFALCYCRNSEFKKGKTMAHYTLTADTIDELVSYADSLSIPQAIHKLSKQSSRVCIAVPDVSVLPQLKDSFAILDSHKITYTVKLVSMLASPSRAFEFAHFVSDRSVQVVIAVSLSGGAEQMLPTLLSSLVPSVPIISLTLSHSNGFSSSACGPVVGTATAAVASGSPSDAVHCVLRILASGGKNVDTSLAAALEEVSTRREQDFLGVSAKLETPNGLRNYLDGLGTSSAGTSPQPGSKHVRVNSDTSDISNILNLNASASTSNTKKGLSHNASSTSFYGLANILRNSDLNNGDLSDFE
jgi:phosphoribosylcarboxyaminoimidazole (NCAIR) mutase